MGRGRRRGFGAGRRRKGGNAQRAGHSLQSRHNKCGTIFCFLAALRCSDAATVLWRNCVMPNHLSHLRMLEAESLHILREVAGEFARPVMLYSIGKDSSVMLRLAQKAFHPAKPPFPLLHVDTTYKFPEMTEFRDRICSELGFELIVHVPREASENGVNPFRFGTQKCCAILKTKSLLDALAQGGF